MPLFDFTGTSTKFSDLWLQICSLQNSHLDMANAEDFYVLLTMPFTDGKVFGTERFALAEGRLSEVAGTDLPW